MTGPEHYVAAEGFWRDAAAEWRDGHNEDALFKLQIAQVHATLALAAATAQNIRRDGAVTAAADDWAGVLS
jgi:hypothetical protein